MKKEWDDIYKFGEARVWYPDEGVVKFCSRYLKKKMDLDLFEERRLVNRILDAGCGNGRHVVFFSEQGFDTYGIEGSDTAIKVAQKWLDFRKLRADLQTGEVTKLPYDDGFFDVVISYSVIDVLSESDIEMAMNEMQRVCAKGGYLYITMISKADSRFGKGKMIDANTFVHDDCYSEPITRRYFDLNDIKNYFRNLKIFDIVHYEERFPDQYSVNKSPLQSRSGLKSYLDLQKPLEMNLKYAMWHIAAEKA